MRRVVPLLVAAALLAGCSTRERLNPLDPANSSTGGAPQGFAALADNASVELRWANTALNLNVRLYRGVGAAAHADSLIELPPGVDHFFDFGLVNGADYAYEIRYVFANGTVGAAVRDVATPGPARIWVADYAGQSIDRITPDGRHIAQVATGRFQTPYAIDVVGGDVWVCDPTRGILWRVAPGLSETEVGSLQIPVAIAIDRLRSRVWVCDQGLNALQSLDLVNPVSPYVDLTGLARPSSVALDPDGTAWVCERNGDRVRHVNTTGTGLGSAVVLEPSRVAVDSVTHNVWVSSTTQRTVTVLSAAGAPLDTLTGFAGPVGIAIDPIAGTIWIADTNGDRVIGYDRSGTERYRVSNVFQPLELAIERDNGDVWVAQAGAGAVTRVSHDGHVLRTVTGFAQPYDIAIEN